jgi:hypothetical protein
LGVENKIFAVENLKVINRANISKKRVEKLIHP